MRPSFAALSRRRKPNPLVVEALALSGEAGGAQGGRALDLGAGPLNDTRLLLDHGFAVEAVDRDANMMAIAKGIGDSRLTAIERDMRDFEIVPERYDLIVAIHVFPFLTHSEFSAAAAACAAGLAPGGLLCCTLFGRDDEWADTRPKMMFLARSEVEAAFADLTPLVLRERKYDGSDATGAPKRWHVHQCIYRKA